MYINIVSFSKKLKNIENSKFTYCNDYIRPGICGGTLYLDLLMLTEGLTLMKKKLGFIQQNCNWLLVIT